ncbi:hypothetical protein AB0I28_15505 [Phytomonospora sp. NPDC050363]|uniref:hypothetical protein n=1 Tax=Phytomonospora sp. NPDC050363 TaxID=3155642 RepID=UPI0033D78EBF
MTDTKLQRFGALGGVAAVALFVASTSITSGTAPLPGEGTGAEIAGYLRGTAGALELQATLQVASAFALFLFAALTASRLAAPYRQLVLGGGVLAAATTAMSAAVTAVMAQDGVIAEEGLLPALQWLAFLVGGPAHAIWFAPLLVGLALGGRASGLFPRWLAVTGTVIGALASLAVVAIAVYYASPFIPLGRYGGFLWILAATFHLVRRPRTSL